MVDVKGLIDKAKAFARSNPDKVRDTRSTAIWPRSVTATPAASRPRSAVRGTEPTASRAWLPRICRPSSSSTTTASLTRRTAVIRERPNTVIPRSRNTCSMTWAASASSPGRTRSREDTRVT